jgi:hypothetical protein
MQIRHDPARVMIGCCHRRYRSASYPAPGADSTPESEINRFFHRDHCGRHGILEAALAVDFCRYCARKRYGADSWKTHS